MIRISLEELLQNAGAYLDQVQSGDTVIILRDGKPVAEVRPVEPKATGQRPYGLATGAFVVPDDFDDPLPAEILADFEGD